MKQTTRPIPPEVLDAATGPVKRAMLSRQGRASAVRAKRPGVRTAFRFSAGLSGIVVLVYGYYLFAHVPETGLRPFLVELLFPTIGNWLGLPLFIIGACLLGWAFSKPRR